jgi:acetylornithine deacetylase/succinyl-diaminopimelate desuccinylase-like protein
MAKDFWIDSSDPPYPAIRHRSYPTFDPRFNDAMTLTEARREIKEHCRSHRQHWLAVMHHQVDQTAEAIIEEALEVNTPGPSLKKLMAEEQRALSGETDA